MMVRMLPIALTDVGDRIGLGGGFGFGVGVVEVLVDFVGHQSHVLDAIDLDHDERRAVRDIGAVNFLHRVVQHPAIEQKRSRHVLGRVLDDGNEGQREPRIVGIAQGERLAEFPSVLAHQHVSDQRAAAVRLHQLRLFRR